MTSFQITYDELSPPTAALFRMMAEEGRLDDVLAAFAEANAEALREGIWTDEEAQTCEEGIGWLTTLQGQDSYSVKDVQDLICMTVMSVLAECADLELVEPPTPQD